MITTDHVASKLNELYEELNEILDRYENGADLKEVVDDYFAATSRCNAIINAFVAQEETRPFI